MRNWSALLILILFATAMPIVGYEGLRGGPSGETGRPTLTGDGPIRWGGDGIILTVEKNSASMQFGCARAAIPSALKTSHGKFNVTGTYTPNTAIASAKTPNSTAIRVEGQIKGKNMTLKLTALDTGKVIGNYTLERGKAIALSRCR